MKTRYQYIRFVKVRDKPKTSVWHCENNRSAAQLGIVRWYGPWRQYCFFATCATAVFNSTCLADIQDFIGQLERER